MFQRNDFIKLVDTTGNYRFGYISKTESRGSTLIIDLSEEGLNKIAYDSDYATNRGDSAADYRTLLTGTEKKIVPLLGSFLTTKEIASQMNISPVTVRSHIRDLKNKLGLDTREQLVAYSQGICKTLKL